MKFSGEFRVPAPRGIVFQRINDPVFFATCIEGVSDLTEIESDRYSAVLETRIAFIRFSFDIVVDIVEAEEPSRIVARAEGEPKGMVGRLTSVAVASLADDGEETLVSYDIDLGLAGKLGSIGQPVLRSKAKEMERTFIKNLNASFAEGAKEVQAG